MFLAPNFLGLHYKIQPDVDHVAKFHGDQPTELGDPVAKLKKIKYKISICCKTAGLPERLSDTSSHDFEVHVDTSSHGRRDAVAVGVFSSA